MGCSLGGKNAGGTIQISMQVIDKDTIRKRLRAVPEAPGCYLLRDGAGKVIYVGKALRLRGPRTRWRRWCSRTS
jgi:hypothetical protein